MAIDLTAANVIRPTYKGVAAAGTTCTQIQAPPLHEIRIVASGAIYIFNNVADGGSAPDETGRIPITADVAAAGWTTRVGGADAGKSYGTVCVAAQSGTVVLGVELLPNERGL
jgi:hypothetical protein